MTKKANQLLKLIDRMTSGEVAEIFDIDVHSIANEDAQGMDEMALDSFIADCQDIIKQRKD